MRHELAKGIAGLVFGAAILSGVPADADDWDVGADPDNGLGTDNELFHGSEQVHDLSGPTTDQDWFRTSIPRFSSYEFVIDGFTGDLDLASGDMQSVNAAGVVLQDAQASDAGGVLSLTLGTGASPQVIFVRVQGAACGTACDSSDTYRARFYETTYTVPRFNNSGTQTTVLLLQNATDRPCNGDVVFLDSSGAAISGVGMGFNTPHALDIINTASIVPNRSGSVRIAHGCGYGGLSGKAVSIEPATGFTFDTPVLHRPR